MMVMERRHTPSRGIWERRGGGRAADSRPEAECDGAPTAMSGR